MVEEFYKISVTSFDQTTSDHFTVPNATRFTTAGTGLYWIVFSLQKGTRI